MSMPEEARNCTRSLVMSIYLLVDKVIPYAIKITFPFWAVPFLFFMLAWKTFRLWKHIFNFAASLLNPNSPPVLAYAILKGNGQYLRSQSEDVLTHQFYDYTSRKFMSIPELDSSTRIAELECNSLTGMQYMSKYAKVGFAKGYTSCKRKIRYSQVSPLIEETTYAIEGKPNNIDCFLLFNFKSKVNFLKNTNLDLIDLLKYCRYHLQNDGYLVYGDYFEKGQEQTFRMLFKSFDFKIVEEEDITRNIEYAKKLMEKDRHQYEVKILRRIKQYLGKLLKRKPYSQNKYFHVFIMEKNHQ